MNDDPVLYILMRSDMASLTPGKACAQAAHASTMLECYLRWEGSMGKNQELYHEWSKGSDFGTTIVISVKNDIYLYDYVKSAKDLKIVAGDVVDPSYPLADGEFTHKVPVVTCAYIFGRLEDVAPLLIDLELMP